MSRDVTLYSKMPITGFFFVDLALEKVCLQILTEASDMLLCG